MMDNKTSLEMSFHFLGNLLKRSSVTKKACIILIQMKGDVSNTFAEKSKRIPLFVLEIFMFKASS